MLWRGGPLNKRRSLLTQVRCWVSADSPPLAAVFCVV